MANGRVITQTLALWAEAHPRRDLPVVQLGDGSELTPRDIGDDRRAQLTLCLLEEPGVPSISLDDALGVFRADANRWEPEGFER